MSTKTERVPKSMSDNRILKISSWIRGFHIYKDQWTPTCSEILPLQPEPGNAEDKNVVAVLKESQVLAFIPFHLANTKNHTGIVTHFISKPTNKGSVEIYGKVVKRGGGLGIEIPCVYIFDGPRKHMDLIEKLLDISNNPAIHVRDEDDLGPARSKQTTSKRKKVKSNDRNKKPRK